LVSNALYWCQEFHIDGLRVDAVASMLYLDYSRQPDQWVPNIYGGNENLEAIDFLKYVTSHLYQRCPGVIMIAEESTSFAGVTKPVDQGGLGFGFKWNMGWMNDTLRYIELDPVYRQWHHNLVTFAMVYAYSENFILPISHDEVVHGKGSMINKIPQDDWRKFATLRSYHALQWAFPGKQLIFMGCEFGQRREFTEAESLEWWVSDLWGHHGLQLLFHDLNAIYKDCPALWRLDNQPEGFRWIDADDYAANLFSWYRSDDEGHLVACLTNFSATTHQAYRIGLPAAGRWQEILNTNDQRYDGSGDYLNGQVEANLVANDGLPASATIQVPALSTIWLEFSGAGEAAS
jgi:1,4-alpha-glucan branching enzyme